MIVEERMLAYINSLDQGHTPFLEKLAGRAAEERVPIIRREMQSFLKVFLMIQQPRKILEVGTAIGFSAVFMAEYGPRDCRVTTIENYEKRIPLARENFRLSGYEDRIRLIPGDAAEVLKTLEGPYDLIFMDAAKGQYIRFLPEVLRLLRPGGVLISDNVPSGRGHHPVPLSGGEKKPNDLQENAGISVYPEAQSGTGNHHYPPGRRDHSQRAALRKEQTCKAADTLNCWFRPAVWRF